MRRHRRIVMIILLLAGGCRGLPQRPSLPPAHEESGNQLVFHCDFELPPQHRLVRELNDERQLISSTLALPPSDERIDVYLFHDAETYAHFLARRFPKVPSRRAFFVESDQQLAVYAHWSDRVAEDLRHEVAHGYLHSMVRDLPLWLDEGLAEYFEVPSAQAGLNRPHLELLADMMRFNGWQPNLARLETLSDAAQMNQCDYAEAWAWVYFTMAEPARRELMTTYLADLRRYGTVESLPTRLAKRYTPLNAALAEFLAAETTDTVAATANPPAAK
jgi:hypothetical protein